MSTADKALKAHREIREAVLARDEEQLVNFTTGKVKTLLEIQIEIQDLIISRATAEDWLEFVNYDQLIPSFSEKITMLDRQIAGRIEHKRLCELGQQVSPVLRHFFCEAHTLAEQGTATSDQIDLLFNLHRNVSNLHTRHQDGIIDIVSFEEGVRELVIAAKLNPKLKSLSIQNSFLNLLIYILNCLPGVNVEFYEYEKKAEKIVIALDDGTRFFRSNVTRSRSPEVPAQNVRDAEMQRMDSGDEDQRQVDSLRTLP